MADRPTSEAIVEQRMALGNALVERAPTVVAEMHEESLALGSLGADIEALFAEAADGSTRAIGAWIGGLSAAEARKAGADASELFGHVAAHRSAPLNEITKRCLRWRDRISVALEIEAERLGACEEALTEAVAMMHRSFDATLVRLCAAFEVERQRIHEELERRQAELSHRATHDDLTGLANRALILDRVEQGLARARRTDHDLMVLFLDLDNFKHVNDAYGHAAGDELLRAVVARLRAVVRETDTLGRIGGDEFVVVAEDVCVGVDCDLIAERVLEALRAPFHLDAIGDLPLTVTASLGMATGSDGTAEELLREADIAMYQAKLSGRDSFAVFDGTMGMAARTRLDLECALRVAVQEQQFFTVYQPILDLTEMRTIGLEALARWNHPELGVVMPNDFIPVLEETGLIIPMGRQILDQACHDAAALQRSGHDICVSVNVSGRQLDSEQFLDDLIAVLASSGLAPDRLTIEITETAVMVDTHTSALRLNRIRQLGVRVAIDDFGTGYSSLDHLRHFPIDTLKIDRSFIEHLSSGPGGEAIVTTLVGLAGSLSIRTLAEGIENADQLAFLLEHDCRSGQGFLFARPLPIDQVEDYLNHPTVADGEPLARPIAGAVR